MTAALNAQPAGDESTNLDRARALAAAGVPVFVAPPNPYYVTDDSAREALPRDDSRRSEYLLPAKWQHTRPDPATLDSWRPGHAVCVVTGLDANGCGVDAVDVDTKHGADPSEHLDRLRALGVNVIGAVSTPSGGAHFYVRASGVRNASRPVAGVDYRGGDSGGGGRGFVFAPGTSRPKYGGAGYAWLRPLVEADLEDLSRREDDADGVEAYLSGIGVAVRTADAAPSLPAVSAERLPDSLPDWLRAELADLGEQTTNNYGAHALRWRDASGQLTHSRSERFYRLAGACARAQLTQGQTVAALTPWCEAVGKYVGREAVEVARIWARVEADAQLAVRPTLTALADVTPVEPDAPWEEPIPLGGRTAPTLDIEGLPEWLRDMVNAVTEQSQSPREVVLAAALGTITAATRGAYDVMVTDAWNAGPTVLWFTALAPSGERKGAGTHPLVRPLQDAEAVIASDVRRANRNREAERKRLTAVLKQLEQQPDADPAHVAHVTDSLHEMRARPVPHLVISDATSEALGQHMTAQGGAVFMQGTEGSAFKTAAGRYSDSGADYSLLNHAYDGEQYDDLRVKREGLHIPRPALTWASALQPDVIAGYANAQSEGSGFLARFALLVPESRVGKRNMRTAATPAHISERWAEVVQRLHAHSWDTYSTMCKDMPDSMGQPSQITFHADAAEMLLTYAERLESEKHPGSAIVSLGGWIEKHPARIARLAAVFALAETPGAYSVNARHVAAALSIADGLVQHALAAFAVLREASKADPAARTLQALRQLGVEIVTTRQVHQAVSGQTSWVTSSDDVRRALVQLTDYGWVRPLGKTTGNAGGRPSERWQLHESVLRRAA